jgi:hypothetical protein
VGGRRRRRVGPVRISIGFGLWRGRESSFLEILINISSMWQGRRTVGPIRISIRAIGVGLWRRRGSTLFELDFDISNVRWRRTIGAIGIRAIVGSAFGWWWWRSCQSFSERNFGQIGGRERSS